VGVAIFTIFGLWAIILPPDMLQSQSRALKTRMIVQLPKKLSQKIGSLDWRPGLRKVGHKNAKTPLLVTSRQENPKPKTGKNFVSRN